jgi:intracellular sulfur oxidation DsrE/DsrF family protein
MNNDSEDWTMKKFLLSILCFFYIFSISYAGQLQTESALRGLTTVKLVCDVNVGDPALLLTRMYLLDETYSQLLDAGIKPVIVVAFRGKATPFITRGDKYVANEHRQYKHEMKDWIDLFDGLGFTIEQCAIAAKANHIDPKDFLPHVKIVKNGYISLVGYQNQGYALLPMD